MNTCYQHEWPASKPKPPGSTSEAVLAQSAALAKLLEMEQPNFAEKAAHGPRQLG